MGKEYQIINGERWPSFPFWVKNIDTKMAMEVLRYDEDRDAFSNNHVRSYVKDSVLISVTETEHDRTVPTPEKRYKPWVHEDVKSILFFKDKAFRFKEQPTNHSFVTCYDNYDDKGSVHISGWSSCKMSNLFNDFEYSTDGETWLPCGVEITE